MNKFKCLMIISIIVYSFFLNGFSQVSIATDNYKTSFSNSEFTVFAKKTSFFQLDHTGKHTQLKDGVPYQGENEEHFREVTFNKTSTAFILIDPWINMPKDFMNKHPYFKTIIYTRIIPLIKKAAHAGFPIYIFTNDCQRCGVHPFSCKIPDSLISLERNHSNVKIFFWQGFNIDEFTKTLKGIGVNKLIYSGFASNICILLRRAGMFEMKQRGFDLYFIPEASAAVETKDTFITQELHHAMTKIISQGLASLIKYQDIDTALQ